MILPGTEVVHLFNKYWMDSYLTNTRAAEIHLPKIIYKIASRKDINSREVILQ